jgi:hypothetical protein
VYVSSLVLHTRIKNNTDFPLDELHLGPMYTLPSDSSPLPPSSVSLQQPDMSYHYSVSTYKEQGLRQAVLPSTPSSSISEPEHGAKDVFQAYNSMLRTPIPMDAMYMPSQNFCNIIPTLNQPGLHNATEERHDNNVGMPNTSNKNALSQRDDIVKAFGSNASQPLWSLHVDSVQPLSRVNPIQLQKKQATKERLACKESFEEDYDILIQQLRRGISELAEKHSKKEAYIEGMIFNGRMHYLRDAKTSSWNAWLHCKYQDINTGQYSITFHLFISRSTHSLTDMPVEERVSLKEIQDSYIEEYYTLTEAEKSQYVQDFEVHKDEK